MAKKSQQVVVTPEFQGDYVQDIADSLVASALSGTHVVLLSAPGYGKTRIAREVASMIYGQRIDRNANGGSNGNWVFLRMESSTPPEDVKGLPDPAAMLATPPRIEYNRHGTMYDPRAKLFVVDEVFRPSDVVFDTFLDGLDKQDENYGDETIVWGTSNFVAQGDRLAAVRDRITLWVWVTPKVSMRDVAMAHLMSAGQGLKVKSDHIPDMQTVSKIRAMSPTDRSANAVADMVESLSREAVSIMQTPEHVNPRRAYQWQRILFTVSAYYHDTNDFEFVHPKAVYAVRNAWPAFNVDTHRRWGDVITKVADVVGSAMTAATEAAYKSFNQIASDNTSNMPTKIERLGQAMAEAEEMMGRFGNDKRTEEAMEKIKAAFSKAATLIMQGG